MSKADLLSKVCKKCYEISINSKADVFFYYSPQCNAYSVNYYMKGWKENVETIYIDIVTDITMKNLKRTLNELDKIYKKRN